MDKKKITRKGYRVLAILWTMAAAAMAMAFVRRLAEFNLFLLLMTVLSTLTAASFWKSYHRTPEEEGVPGQFDAPPKFADDPALFDDDPPPVGSQLFADDDDPPLLRGSNQDPEEKDHE